jgi:hypothetical protein
MSREYRPIGFIPFDELTDSRLEKYGVFVDLVGNSKMLYGSDGGYVFAHPENPEGCALFQNHADMPGSVRKALLQEFGQEIVDEDDPRFWGV